MPEADLVLEGGGMKGLGLVGAVVALMRRGYAFGRVAGTSVGALVGALVAAGLDADELDDAMRRLPYARLADRAAPGIPVLSESLSLLRDRGAYEGDVLRRFVADELAARGVATFGDLRRTDAGADPNLERYQRYRLVVMATDVTRGRLLRLPWDYRLLGLDPDRQLVADAVRASASLPLFFAPVEVRDGRTEKATTLVDGGVLSNFPIEIFDRTDGAAPRWPTFGVRITAGLSDDPPGLLGLPLPPLGPVRLLERVLTTAVVGHDQTYLQRPCVRRRTIVVDTDAVGVVQFDASARTRRAVVARGERAAERFLQDWDWARFRRECANVSAEG